MSEAELGKKPSGPRFKTARFHVETGPQSLFDRVRFKMAGRRKLKFHAAHLRQRLQERGVPTDLLQQFDADTWELVSAEVRVDTGKFVNSTWVCEGAGERWWVVIGFRDTVENVLAANKVGLGPDPDIVTSGPLYQRVRQVNEVLMDDEG